MSCFQKIDITNFSFPLYGYHLLLGSHIIYNERELLSFVSFLEKTKTPYMYRQEYFADSWENLYNEREDYSAIWNSESNQEIKKEIFYRWVFHDRNDLIFPMRNFIQDYINHKRYYKNPFNIISEKVRGKPIRGTGKVRGKPIRGTGKVRYKKWKGNAFQKQNYTEQERQEEYCNDYGRKYFKMFSEKQYQKVTCQKFVRDKRDEQFKSWKLHRKTQYKY